MSDSSIELVEKGTYQVGDCSYYPFGSTGDENSFPNPGTVEILHNGLARVEGFCLRPGETFRGPGFTEVRPVINGLWTIEGVHGSWPAKSIIYLRRGQEELSLHELELFTSVG